MKARSQWWQVLVGLACSLFLLTACGGGGGGGGNDGPSIPSTYTGLTTQAVLTETNAVEIVSGALEGGMGAEDVGGALPLAAQDSQISGGVQVSNLFKDLALQAISPGQDSISPLATIADTLTGDCGGSFSYSITVDDSSGAITNSYMAFDNYCSGGVTINGTLPISGSATADVIKIKMGFDNISVTSDTMSQTLTSGSITIVSDYSTNETETLNYVLIDNNSLQTFFISNYVLKVTYGTPDTATLTGRYYHPDHGYVGISTLATLTVPDTVLPTGGTLRFSGSGSRADLTFNADQSTLLQLDTNNDGTYESTFVDQI